MNTQQSTIIAAGTLLLGNLIAWTAIGLLARDLFGNIVGVL